MSPVWERIAHTAKLFLFLALAALFVYYGSVYALSYQEFIGELNCSKMNPTCWVAGDGIDKPGMFGRIALAGAIFAVGKCGQPDVCPSATSALTTTMAGLYGYMPASSELALRDFGESLGIVKPVYAQGTGFSGLRNVKVITEVFRNVMLVGYILIFLGVGFMIMFRFRIDPRTVVSVQNALPRLVLTFVLVWLSYPIAGLLIDLMYVVSFLLFGLFQAIGMPVDGFRDRFQGETVLQFWYFGLGFEGVWRPASSVAHIIAQVLGGGLAGSATSGIAWVLAWLIVAVAILFAVFRTFFQLVTAYIMVLFGVIFAPFWIGAGGLPISLGSIGIGGWTRHMLGYLAAFPVTAGFYMLGAAIMRGTTTSPSEGWVAPLIGAGYAGAAQGLIGLGIILLTPVAVNMTKDFFKSPEFKYLAAIQQGIGTGRAVVLGPAGIPLAMLSHTLQWRGGEWLMGLIPGMKKLEPSSTPPPSQRGGGPGR